MKLTTILLAVDFDDASDALLAAVPKLAKPFGSEIVLLHAIEPAEHRAYEETRLEGMIKARLQEMSCRLSADGLIISDVLCPKGKASSEIAAASERCKANVIMIGARGVAAHHQFPLGTTTETVIRTAPRPVLALHPSKPLDLTNIVCPVDFSDASACGLSNAIRLSHAFHSRLHVLTVIPPPSRYHRLDQAWSAWAIRAEAQAATEAVRELNDFLQQFDLRSLTWDKQIERGDSAEQIVAAVQAFNAGLVVMGSTGRTGLPYMLMGSTAIKVARRLPCSLLTVKRNQAVKVEVEQNTAGAEQNTDSLGVNPLWQLRTAFA